MSEKKPGCAVRVQVDCLDETGQVISDIPSGGWYGYDRPTANAMAIDLNRQICDRIEEYNVALYGEKYPRFDEVAKGKK